MNTLLPLVSIGVPTYNRPAELSRCLEGLIGQTYPNLEIVVSDNASHDASTEALVREFMQRDPRISYFRQTENRGALFNFQFVLDQANGEFFMWAGDDDYRAPNFVEVLLGLMHQHPDCVLSFCDFMEVDDAGNAVDGYPQHLPLLQPFASSGSLIRLCQYFFQLESKGKANLIYGLMRRATLRDFQWSAFVRAHGEYGVDMLFVFKLLCQGRLALTDQFLYRCAVGNKKEYLSAAPRSLMQKVAMPFVVLAQQLHYSTQYLLIAKGWIRMVLILCWPIKAADIFIRIFLVTEARNFAKRVRRRFSKIMGI